MARYSTVVATRLSPSLRRESSLLTSQATGFLYTSLAGALAGCLGRRRQASWPRVPRATDERAWVMSLMQLRS